MSREIEKVSIALFDKIRSRFDNVSLGDESAKSTSVPDNARFFNFDYVSNADGENFGNVTLSLIDEHSLKVYFSKNISEKLNDKQKREWFNFLKELRLFAKRNLLNFDTRDINRSNLNIKDIRAVTKSDTTLDSSEINMNESRLYGTTRTSFENVGNARIRIIHTESINPDQRGSRARHINAIYVENAQGERFKLTHNRLSGARAMARHISEGGNPYDEVGTHIDSVLSEMSELGRFVRVMRHRTFEDSVATSMVEAAVNHYSRLNSQLNNLKSSRAYHKFLENFEPQTQQLDEVDVNEIKERFVKKIFDDRMMGALPLVYKAYQIQEQELTAQINLVKEIIENRVPLQLTTNESMDEYIKALKFQNPSDLVVRVLEDIASRGAALPQVADFAKKWANNYNNVTEDSDQKLREHKALAVKLATHYLRDLQNLKESSQLRINENELDIPEQNKEPGVLEEGTWALPDSPEDLQALQTLMANPIEVGVDAENATGALYDLIGNDTLFDRLHDLSELEGPRADARDTIKHFLEQNMPGLAEKLSLGNQEMDQAVPAQQPTSPNPPLGPTGGPEAPGVTGPTGTDMPNTESIDFLARLAGIKSILVK